jgi:hypothetical protein
VEGEAQVNDAKKVESRDRKDIGPNQVVFLGKGGDTLFIKDTSDGEAVVFLRDEAIEFAKDILLRYEVPFCNRVEGAGVAN